MSDHLDGPGGWGAVPRVDDIRGTREAPAPQRPRRRPGRRALIGIVAGAAAVVLLAVVGVVGYSAGSASHSPTHPVDAFLDDLESGRVAAALDAAGVHTTKDDVLLTDAAYAKATHRVTGHRIAGVQQDGDTARVGVYLEQGGGGTVPATFTLTRKGTDRGVFPVWRLDPVSLGDVVVDAQAPAGADLRVARQKVTPGDQDVVTLRALPGEYPVSLGDSTWFTAKATTATVRGFGESAVGAASITTTLTDQGQQAVTSAVDAWVDGCIASTSIEPPGCSFYAYGEDPANTYTNEKWTLDSRPTVAVGDWSAQGWVVRTQTPGSATFTAAFTGPAGRGTGSAGPINVYADGYVTGFTDAGATFVPAVGNGSSDSGS